MNNVTVINDVYTNIQGVGVKKIKLTEPNLRTLFGEAKKVKVVAEEPIKEIEEVKPVVEEKHDEEVPIHFFSGNMKKNYDFDEVAIKEKVAENYKNLANFEKKEEKKVEVAPKTRVTEKEFEKLLSTDVVIMQDKMDKFRSVFNEKQTKLKDAKLNQARLADSFQKVSSDQQNAKFDSEVKKKRISEMKNAEHFAYLEIGKDEDDRMIEAVRLADNALKNLYNVNQVIYKETIAKIEQYENDKNTINKESEKVRAEISKSSEDLNKFMENNEPLIREIIKINEKYKDAEVETEKAIGDEYNALTRVKNTEVGINLSFPEENVTPVIEPVQNNIPNINIFENFRRADSQGGSESAVGINDIFGNNYDEQSAGYRRAA